MNLLNSFHAKSVGIGLGGLTLLGITPGTPTDLVHVAIAVVTGIVQIVHLIKANKKQKNQNP